MLTRFKVNGFKNLLDVDIYFGPFTCIAGANGIGKSNLFDAITFLGSLGSKTFLEAAQGVRDEHGRTGDVRNLFHRIGERYQDRIDFLVEMIVPTEGQDDLGQKALATSTFLTYKLSIGYREPEESSFLGPIELLNEELTYIPKGKIAAHVLFPHDKQWSKGVTAGREGAHRSAPFLSTENGIVSVHQDGGSRGRAITLNASGLPRTVISSINAAEGPTITLARQELRSWRLLQLEPSKMRSPDLFDDPKMIGADGSHLAATLHRVALLKGPASAGNTYEELTNKLAELIEDVRSVSVDADERVRRYTLQVKQSDGTVLPAMALSDGTLRFLALAIYDLDPQATGVICLEEPENGIHPQRIKAILDLIKGIALDAQDQPGFDNPLRQVIINTHSPAVVANIGEDDLVIAGMIETSDELNSIWRRKPVFRCLKGTWRETKGLMSTMPLGNLAPYMNFYSPPPKPSINHKRKVVEREDVRQYLINFGNSLENA